MTDRPDNVLILFPSKRAETEQFIQQQSARRFTGSWVYFMQALLEAGCTHKEVAAVTGHSHGMIEHYAKSVDQLKLNEAAMRKMEA